ncbi:MAG: sulfatase-like hydrolase/transferase [Planctomycetes bacterium]|nr:sulfatase-like hydrolase/transferase [Planctomycetota bacterium]
MRTGASDPRRAEESPSGGRPNVLLIMTDTQRKDDMGIYGNPAIRTPNLDAIARGGVRFESAFSQAPVCMPARATIFTGRYPMAHRVRSNGVPLPRDEQTLAHLFARAGCRTGGAGKFHFIPHFPYRSPLPMMETHPEPYYGFQEFHLGEDGRSGEHWVWMKRTHPEYVDKPDHQIPPELHNSHWVADHTIDFIRRCAADGRRFFAFASFVDPHQPYNPPPPYRGMYREADMPPPLRREGELDRSRFKKLAENLKAMNDRVAYHRTQHYGEMTFIDDSVGRIVKTLEDVGLREDTIIAFVADHGDMLGDHWLWWKGPYHYPGCSNVPLFFDWPGHLVPGKVVRGFAQQTDVLPTLLDLAGIEIPPGVQGRSLRAVLETDRTDTGYESAYIEYATRGAIHPDFPGGSRAGREGNDRPVDTFTIRTESWRCTVHSGLSQGELYDLEEDPDEFVNLWDDPAKRGVRGDLVLALIDRIAATRDPLPLREKPY